LTTASSHKPRKKRSRTAVLLAGTLKPSPLRRALDVPVLCLPLGATGTVLDAWIDALATVGGCDDVRIVVNTDDDVRTLEPVVRDTEARHRETVIRTIVEPASWRGAGGILRDVTDDLATDALVLVIEATAMPLRTLRPLPLACSRSSTGVVGALATDEPAGVYAFRRRAFEHVPSVGYYDLKEQLLPALAEAKLAVRAVRLDGQPTRIRDAEGYLDAVRFWFAEDRHEEESRRIAGNVSVADSAIIAGTCIIERDVTIGERAVVHDAVILAGATIGEEAAVSRGVIGSGAVVEPQQRVVGGVIDASTPRHARQEAPRRRRSAA
jgi:hypothetical protein